DGGRSKSRVDYVSSLRRTAWMPLERIFTGHGPPLCDARSVVAREFAQHRERCRRIIRLRERGAEDAFTLAREMWRDAIVREQPLLVVWEVLGHLDLLLDAGIAHERLDDDGRWRYALARTAAYEQGADHLVQAS